MSEAQPRNRFDQEFYLAAKQFADDILAKVPELDSIVITPSWNPPQPHLPSGVVVSRGSDLQRGSVVLRLIDQLSVCMQTVTAKLDAVVAGYNAKLEALAAKAKEQTDSEG